MAKTLTKAEQKEKAQFDAEDAVIDRVFDFVLDETPRRVDIDGVFYGLFVRLLYCLAENGWTAEQLAKDVQWHVERADSEGSVN